MTAVKSHNFVFFSEIASKSREIQRQDHKSGDFISLQGETAQGRRGDAKSRVSSQTPET